MTEGLQITIPRRLVFLRIALTSAVLISMLLTINLWAGSRYFPRMPVSPGMDPGVIWEGILFSLAALCLIGSMFFQWQRLLIGIALLCLLLLVLSDLNRLQPWFYLYGSMLCVFLFYNGRVDDSNHYTSIFVVLQIIFVSVYFFSGLNLLAHSNAREEMESFSEPVKRFVSDRQFAFLVRTTGVIPYLLIFTGLGLLLPALRYLALSVAVLGHVMLIWLFFPSAEFPVYAEWFVHIPFLALLPLLCSGPTSQRHFSFSSLLQRPLFYICMIPFVILPLGRVTGITSIHLPRTPGMLRPQKGVITFDNVVYSRLPDYLRSYCRQDGEGYLLDHLAWSRSELHATSYPVPRVYESVRSHVAQQAMVGKEDVHLELH